MDGSETDLGPFNRATLVEWPMWRAQPHHVMPDSGWVSFYIRQLANVEEAISLLRRSFKIAVDQRSWRGG